MLEVMLPGRSGIADERSLIIMKVSAHKTHISTLSSGCEQLELLLFAIAPVLLTGALYPRQTCIACQSDAVRTFHMGFTIPFNPNFCH